MPEILFDEKFHFVGQFGFPFADSREDRHRIDARRRHFVGVLHFVIAEIENSPCQGGGNVRGLENEERVSGDGRMRVGSANEVQQLIEMRSQQLRVFPATMSHRPGGAAGERFFIRENERHQSIETLLAISDVGGNDVRLLSGMFLENGFSDIHDLPVSKRETVSGLNQQSWNRMGDAELRQGAFRRNVALMSMESVIVDALGEKGIREMVAAFYRRVPNDDLIGPMYPDDDWQGSEERLAGFLLFRFGLSDEYTQKRGHPRLRMRHMPFSIGEAERDRWLQLMGEAMTEVGLEGEVHETLTAFFAQVADFMRNRAD